MTSAFPSIADGERLRKANRSVRIQAARRKNSIHTNTSTASQNEQAVRNLRLGMTISSVLSFIIRLIFRRNSLLPPSLGLAAIFVLTFAPALFIYRYLVKIGTTRRHPTTGELLSPGEDLNQPGVTEWAFDVLYVTCMSFLFICCL